MNRTNSRISYLFLLPAMALLCTFIVYPIVYNLLGGFYSWTGLTHDKGQFIGLTNYVKLFQDQKFLLSMRNAFVLIFFATVVRMTIAVILAHLLYSGVFGERVFRILFYVPVVIAPIVIGKIFSYILQDLGSLNIILRAIRLDFLALPWLTSKYFAIVSIAAVDGWKWTGYCVLVYFASLMGISTDIFEAATIDGANYLQKFLRLAVPLLKSAHLTLLVLGTVGSLAMFDTVYILTRGGPGDATIVLSLYIWRQGFEFSRQGYTSALSNVLLIMALCITILQLRIFRRGTQV
ncbi:Lactose transport system permease protein LacF [subsurface metagenome]